MQICTGIVQKKIWEFSTFVLLKKFGWGKKLENLENLAKFGNFLKTFKISPVFLNPLSTRVGKKGRMCDLVIFEFSYRKKKNLLNVYLKKCLNPLLLHPEQIRKGFDFFDILQQNDTKNPTIVFFAEISLKKAPLQVALFFLGGGGLQKFLACGGLWCV